ncbi:TIGR01777 family oxidoreductase [Methylomonas sp. SURF-1]|uniref:TIGR01777 family oxidoreductase n=1 Tax=Methylomonas aurea TaxID=2952224 RepID=A0ABT1UJ30_9GAMM|nr:TIGR01777 family oxidoreductase [Methylomonas sp. SURF-1]MCQ8182250.1 TIGR01777 family oxidoreductase [Methylomonas sp. SURF-1]
MNPTSILITGGTGFLGSALARRLSAKQYAVTVFGRDADKIRKQFGADVGAATRFADLPDAGAFDAVVNLAGAGIFDRYWTEPRKKVLRDSRIELTRELVTWIAAGSKAPVLVNGSAIGVYGDQGDTLLSEASPAKADFAQQLCADWEAAALAAADHGSRVCLIRTGLVLGRGGGLLQRMLPAFRLGLGGSMGDGRQWMSWIHLEDWLAAAEAMIADPAMSGAYNATAPEPATNREFSRTLAAVLGRPMLLPLPAFLLKLLLGEMSALVLGSQRVKPERLLAHGFQFQYSQLRPALDAILHNS